MKKIKKHEIFIENCGNDTTFIAIVSIIIAILSFSLFTEIIKGTVNVNTLNFFLLKLTCWFIISISISEYYYKIKCNVIE